MRSIELTLKDFNKTKALMIGYKGEHNATQISVDVTDWLTEWPNATINVYCQNGNGDVYPALNPTIESNVVTWKTISMDTLIEGSGYIQLDMTATDGTRIKTAMRPTVVERSLTMNSASGVA